MVLQPLVELPPSDGAKETGMRDGSCADTRRVSGGALHAREGSRLIETHCAF